MNITSFVGKWKAIDDDSTMRIIIRQVSSKQIQIEAYDLYDNERLDVIDVKISNEELSFSCRVPSTGYFTMNKMKLSDYGTISHEITIFETWVRENNDEVEA
jgi:hypothetical protein